MQQEKAQVMLKALLQHFHHNEELLRFLPGAAAAIKQRPQPAAVDFPSLLNAQKWLLHIHYSWFYPHFRKLSKETLSLYLSLLSERQADGLRRLLSQNAKSIPLSQFARFYLTNHLKKLMIPSTILPEELIAPTKMSILLTLSQSHLLTLIDFLGLYDLSADLKQVVDKQLLKKVHASLTVAEKLFLQEAMQAPSKWVSPKLGLAGWNGERKTLTSLLHSRGLVRLSKAICLENDSYKWYLVRRFDTSRGRVITNELAKVADSNLVPFFQGQLTTIIKRFK